MSGRLELAGGGVFRISAVLIPRYSVPFFQACVLCCQRTAVSRKKALEILILPLHISDGCAKSSAKKSSCLVYLSVCFKIWESVCWHFDFSARGDRWRKSFLVVPFLPFSTPLLSSLHGEESPRQYTPKFVGEEEEDLQRRAPLFPTQKRDDRRKKVPLPLPFPLGVSSLAPSKKPRYISFFFFRGKVSECRCSFDALLLFRRRERKGKGKWAEQNNGKTEAANCRFLRQRIRQ